MTLFFFDKIYFNKDAVMNSRQSLQKMI